ncbi:methyltransferase domain-containing protein [Mucilaginibacter sp.]|jgi:demethylmenaquinone methyltransferase/2-methoxy-6-polyprenyl-1,4-benzoquinol methylase|uniref:methyltransferase domain-containing protein n=1 Tax=Mucilaginibacter sp. TaxID=1882438 RepID=UPI003566C3EA
MRKDDRTPLYAKYLIRLTRPFPDFDFFFIKPLRKKATGLLMLKPGDRVIDMGCGMGGSFPYLVNAVGPTGEVVGVEISPDVIINAKKRIALNNWTNIIVVEAPAQTVGLTGMFNGLLMFGAPDAYASEEALENIIPYLKDNSCVVIFGAKGANNFIGKILNPILNKVFSKLTFATTPGMSAEPWQILSKYVNNITIKEYFFGWMFLASGSVISSTVINKAQLE